MKNQIVINAALALLFTIISIFGEAFVGTYPYFVISDVVYFYCEYDYINILWTILSMVGGVFIISSVFEYISRKFNIRILKYIGTILFSVIIIFSSLFYFVEYLQSKHEYKERLIFYVNLAKEGMENDKIKIDYLGDLGPWIKEGKRNTVDSIMSKYGVVIWYDNFPYSRTNEKAIETYLKIVNAYLDKRNGEGWERRMDAELEPYIDRLEVEH